MFDIRKHFQGWGDDTTEKGSQLVLVLIPFVSLYLYESEILMRRLKYVYRNKKSVNFGNETWRWYKKWNSRYQRCYFPFFFLEPIISRFLMDFTLFDYLFIFSCPQCEAQKKSHSNSNRGVIFAFIGETGAIWRKCKLAKSKYIKIYTRYRSPVDSTV